MRVSFDVPVARLPCIRTPGFKRRSAFARKHIRTTQIPGSIKLWFNYYGYSTLFSRFMAYNEGWFMDLSRLQNNLLRVFFFCCCRHSTVQIILKICETGSNVHTSAPYYHYSRVLSSSSNSKKKADKYWYVTVWRLVFISNFEMYTDMVRMPFTFISPPSCRVYAHNIAYCLRSVLRFHIRYSTTAII